LRTKVIGKPLQPPRSGRKHLALAAFLAWVGLVPMDCPPRRMGRRKRFALGQNSDLVFYPALMTAATVFIIACLQPGHRAVPDGAAAIWSRRPASVRIPDSLPAQR
jgi:hypothetical protein